MKMKRLVFIIIFILFSYNLLFAEAEIVKSRKQSVGVVLSGGGARGIAHIGVLQVLEEFNIPIDYIGGTSFGALVAAFYASGYSPQEVENIIESFDWDVAFTGKQKRQQYYYYTRKQIEANLMQFRFANWRLQLPSSLMNSQKLLNKLLKYFTRPNYICQGIFFHLNPPLLISTTNIIDGKNKIFTKGNLIKTLQASLSVPLLFPPTKIDSFLYVDGGVTNNLPIKAMKKIGADIIIASNTTHFLHKKEKLNSALSFADQLINIMMFSKIKDELKQADLIIRPEVEDVSNTDFSQSPKLIQAGRDATLKYKNKLLSFPLTEHAGIKNVIKKVESKIFNIQKSSIVLEGNTKFTREILLKEVSVIRTKGDLKKLKHRIIQNYTNSGYALIKIDSVKFDKSRLFVFINEGQIDNIEIEGNKLTHAKIILSEISAKPDDVFNINSTLTDVQKIYATDFFKSVIYKLKGSEKGKVDLIFVVEEMPYGIIQAGANYNTERGASAFTSVGHTNVLGSGNKISFFIRFGSERKFGINYQNDRIFNTNFNTKFKLYFKDNTEDKEDRNWNFYLNSGMFDKEKLGIMSLVIDFRESDLTGKERTVGIGGKLIFDSFDKYPYPSKGLFRHASYKNFSKKLGSKTEFHNYKFINRYYFTPIKKVTVSMWINLNLNSSLTGNIPYNRKTNKRPENTFFGFHYDEVIGKDVFYISSQMRILLKKFAFSDPRKELYLIAKVGIGKFGNINSMENFWDIFKEKESLGYSVGIEMPTLFGPVKLFYEDSEENSFWNFSVGYEF